MPSPRNRRIKRALMGVARYDEMTDAQRKVLLDRMRENPQVLRDMIAQDRHQNNHNGNNSQSGNFRHGSQRWNLNSIQNGKPSYVLQGKVMRGHLINHVSDMDLHAWTRIECHKLGFEPAPSDLLAPSGFAANTNRMWPAGQFLELTDSLGQTARFFLQFLETAGMFPLDNPLAETLASENGDEIFFDIEALPANQNVLFNPRRYIVDFDVSPWFNAGNPDPDNMGFDVARAGVDWVAHNLAMAITNSHLDMIASYGVDNRISNLPGDTSDVYLEIVQLTPGPQGNTAIQFMQPGAANALQDPNSGQWWFASGNPDDTLAPIPAEGLDVLAINTYPSLGVINLEAGLFDGRINNQLYCPTNFAGGTLAIEQKNFSGLMPQYAHVPPAGTEEETINCNPSTYYGNGGLWWFGHPMTEASSSTLPILDLAFKFSATTRTVHEETQDLAAGYEVFHPVENPKYVTIKIISENTYREIDRALQGNRGRLFGLFQSALSTSWMPLLTGINAGTDDVTGGHLIASTEYLNYLPQPIPEKHLECPIQWFFIADAPELDVHREGLGIMELQPPNWPRGSVPLQCMFSGEAGFAQTSVVRFPIIVDQDDPENPADGGAAMTPIIDGVADNSELGNLTQWKLMGRGAIMHYQITELPYPHLSN